MKAVLHPYQEFALEHILTNSYSGLFLDMGLGKSLCALTAIQILKDDIRIRKVLVIAPKRVASHTWPEELKKWDHLHHLRYSCVLGDTQARLKALKTRADIYIINRENIPWLVSHLQSGWDFDMVIIDELSSFKSADAIRFKALRMVRPKIKRVVGLTGSPASNGLIDLWPQLYLLDMGERLGKTISGYRNNYFKPDKTKGNVVYSYRIQKDAEQEIYRRISDICISMKSKDYLQLPGRIVNHIPVYLSAAEKAKYSAFEEEQVLQLVNQPEITALTAAALTGKLLQYANGAIYDERKQWHHVHDAKMEALDDILETSQGQPVLIAYSFIHDRERILARFPQAVQLKGNDEIERWNRGEIPVMIAHPASAGHGLNLQAGGNIIVWFGLPWSLELYEQFNARLDRQGQKNGVILNHLVCQDTMDEDVLAALARKASGQDALMEAVKAKILKYQIKLGL